MKRSPKGQEFDVGEGRTEVLYSIGVLALSVGREVQTVALWEKHGVIPATPFVRCRGNGSKIRLYSQAMIEVVKVAAARYGRVLRPEETMELRRMVKEGWSALGVEMRSESAAEPAAAA